MPLLLTMMPHAADYLEMLIGQEKAKINVGDDDRIYNRTESMMVMYKEEKDLFEKKNNEHWSRSKCAGIFRDQEHC